MLFLNNDLYNRQALWGAQQLTKDHAGFIQSLMPLFEPTLTISDTGIARHTLLKWRRAGLVEAKGEEGDKEWSRFNLMDYFWLKLIEKMEDLKLPLQAQLKLKEALFYVYPDFYQKFTESLEMIKGNKEFFEALPPEVAYMLLHQREQLKQQIEASARLMTPLTFITTELLRKNSIASLLINKDLEVGVVIFNEYDKQKRLEAVASLFAKSFTSINLNELFTDIFISRKLEPEYYHGVELLGEREVEVIRAIRSLGLREVTIRFDQQSNIILIEKVKKPEVRKIQEKVRSLARKGKVVIHEMVHDEGGNLRLFIEREQTKFPSENKREKKK